MRKKAGERGQGWRPDYSKYNANYSFDLGIMETFQIIKKHNLNKKKKAVARN